MAKLLRVPVQLQLLLQLALVQVQMDRLLVEQGREESVETAFFHLCHQLIYLRFLGIPLIILMNPRGVILLEMPWT